MKNAGIDRPYTTKEMFDLILEMLTEKGMYPKDLLDYHFSSNTSLNPINFYEFNVIANTHFGGCEGIYTEIYLIGNIGVMDKYGKPEDHGEYYLGSFKTLMTSDDAFRQMALLGANAQIVAHHFIEENLDRFSWKGYSIRGYHDNNPEKYHFGIECYSEDSVIKNMDRFLAESRCDYITLVKLDTRETVKLTKEEIKNGKMPFGIKRRV